jgi:hypothetical protein
MPPAPTLGVYDVRGALTALQWHGLATESHRGILTGHVGDSQRDREVRDMSVWDDPHEKLQLHLSPHTDTLDIKACSGFLR